MHVQPVYREHRLIANNPSSPVADSLFSRGLCLPSGSGMTEDQQTRVIDALFSVLPGGGFS